MRSLGMLTGLVELKEDWRQRQQNYHDDGVFDVVTDECDVAKEMSEGGNADGPNKPTNEVVGDECAVLHLAHACHDWSERADNRHKASQEDGLRPMLLEERMSLGDMALLEEAGIFSSEQGWANLATE